VTYNGRPFNDFTVQRAATYIEQTDEHIAELTCAPSFSRTMVQPVVPHSSTYHIVCRQASERSARHLHAQCVHPKLWHNNREAGVDVP